MSENLVAKSTAEQIFGMSVEGGVVSVYWIKNETDNPYFSNFYIATLDNKSGEKVWGIGKSVVSALKNAKRNWDRVTDYYSSDYSSTEEDIYDNPFRKALETIQKIDKGHLTGGVTIKEVDTMDVGNGKVSVYEVKTDSNNLLFHDFYIAMFSNQTYGEIYGFGKTPEEALENAEMEWERRNPGIANNPFREVLEMSEENNNMYTNTM